MGDTWIELDANSLWQDVQWDQAHLVRGQSALETAQQCFAQFKKLVKQGKIHYYIAGNGIGGKQMGGSQAASEIAQWVEENFTSQTIDGVTLYDLTQSQQ